MKIGVFDSGVGGRSVANAIQKALPADEVVYADDKQHVPYGDKPVEQVHGFVLPILQKLAGDGCEVIVIACNTVTTNLIEQLRQELTMPLIGMEPMIRPAAVLTKTHKITVCATPLTLSSDRYGWLKQNYGADVEIFEPDCSQWARLIEENTFSEQQIRQAIEPSLQAGSDVIVLGCTHYHWIEDEIKEVAAGRAAVLQPEEPVIAELKRVIARLS